VKQILALVFLFSGTFFCWRYFMSDQQRVVSSKWGRRVMTAVLWGSFIVSALFGVLSLSTWRLF